jgi:hypothetical protein
MIIAKHKDGGIYVIHYTGLMKMEDGRWHNAVIYQRVPIFLKPDEKTEEVYVRQVSSFKENFEQITYQEFEKLADGVFSISDMFKFRPNFQESVFNLAS